MPRTVPVALLLLALASAPAAASSFVRFQHGGRATAQAGAFVARGDDPAAVSYNPAAIARLEGLELQVGLDFEAPQTDSESATGSASAEHSIQFPPAAYLAWRPDEATWAVGVGFDAPIWRLVDWQTFDFAGRFTSRGSESRLFEIHPVAAWSPDGRWSFGGGLRLVRGEIGYGDARADTQSTPSGDFAFEIDRRAEADAEGFGFDVGVHWADEAWRFGATWKSEVEIDGSGPLEYQVRDPAALPPDVLAEVRARYGPGRSELSDSLPSRLAAGVAWTLPDMFTVEVDAEWAAWSSVTTPEVTHEPERLGPGFEIGRRAGWEDTLSVRLGAEFYLINDWSVGAGLAFEPSPVTSGAIEPGAPQGDAIVGSLGASWAGEVVAFDVGYSYHHLDDQPARAQETDPDVNSRYGGRVQVWAISARWSF